MKKLEGSSWLDLRILGSPLPAEFEVTENVGDFWVSLLDIRNLLRWLAFDETSTIHAVDDIFVHLRNIEEEMNSEIQNASRYRTRKENRDKPNRDSTKDKELTIMNMDHANLIASKTTRHRSPQGRPTQRACLNCKPFRMGAIPNGDVFRIPRVATLPLRVRRHFDWVSRRLATTLGAVMKGCPPCPGLLEGFSRFWSKS